MSSRGQQCRASLLLLRRRIAGDHGSASHCRSQSEHGSQTGRSCVLAARTYCSLTSGKWAPGATTKRVEGTMKKSLMLAAAVAAISIPGAAMAIDQAVARDLRVDG